MEKQIEKLGKLIKKSKRILLINHIRMDGDAWGSLGGLALILKNMKKDVKAINDCPVPNSLAFTGHAQIIEPDLDVRAYNPDLIIALDSSDRDRLGESYTRWQEVFEQKHLAVIDHHISNPGYGNTNIIDPNASSVCEMVTVIIEQLELYEYVSTDAATLLYTGLQTDSNMYFNSNTRSSTLRAGALLIDLGADFRLPISKLYKNRTANQMKLWQYALSQISYYRDGKICGCVLTREGLRDLCIDRDEMGGYFKGLISEILINIQGVQVAYLIYPLDEKENKVSTRSQKGYDVAEICESFGGGGHQQAAGFQSEESKEIIEKKLLEKIQKALY